MTAKQRTSSASECLHYVAGKLRLTEYVSSLQLVVVDAGSGATLAEIPDLKSVFVVKTSYPAGRFVCVPKRGARRDVERAIAKANEDNE